MPAYCYRCTECGYGFERFRSMDDRNDNPRCPQCENITKRDFRSEQVHVGNIEYTNPLISDSLAIHPDDAAEHRKEHPDVDVMPDGRLKFNDFRSHDNYLKKIGWGKEPHRKTLV